MRHLLITLVVFVCAFSIGSAIRCYSCHSDGESRDCNDSKHWEESECNGEEFCTKIIIGGTDITRSCGYDNSLNVGCRGTPGEDEHCVCDSDLCNGGHKSATVSGLFFFTTLLTLFLARL